MFGLYYYTAVLSVFGQTVYKFVRYKLLPRLATRFIFDVGIGFGGVIYLLLETFGLSKFTLYPLYFPDWDLKDFTDWKYE